MKRAKVAKTTRSALRKRGVAEEDLGGAGSARHWTLVMVGRLAAPTKELAWAPVTDQKTLPETLAVLLVRLLSIHHAVSSYLSPTPPTLNALKPQHSLVPVQFEFATHALPKAPFDQSGASPIKALDVFG